MMTSRIATRLVVARLSMAVTYSQRARTVNQGTSRPPSRLLAWSSGRVGRQKLKVEVAANVATHLRLNHFLAKCQHARRPQKYQPTLQQRHFHQCHFQVEGFNL